MEAALPVQSRPRFNHGRSGTHWVMRITGPRGFQKPAVSRFPPAGRQRQGNGSNAPAGAGNRLATPTHGLRRGLLSNVQARRPRRCGPTRQVERAFRSLKSVDLHLRPIHHRLADRVRAHVLVCLLAYYVEWHLRQRLRPLLFDDEQPGEERPSPVAPAERSAGAQAKARRKRTPDGLTDGLGSAVASGTSDDLKVIVRGRSVRYLTIASTPKQMTSVTTNVINPTTRGSSLPSP